MSLGSHLRKTDHWTFLVGLGVVLVNVRRGDRRLSVVAAVFLLAALAYDVYEIKRGEET